MNIDMIATGQTDAIDLLRLLYIVHSFILYNCLVRVVVL